MRVLCILYTMSKPKTYNNHDKTDAMTNKKRRKTLTKLFSLKKTEKETNFEVVFH